VLESLRNIFNVSCDLAMKGSILKGIYEAFWKNSSKSETSANAFIIKEEKYKQIYNSYCN
jgi:hypothetical protein